MTTEELLEAEFRHARFYGRGCAFVGVVHDCVGGGTCIGYRYINRNELDRSHVLTATGTRPQRIIVHFKDRRYNMRTREFEPVDLPAGFDAHRSLGQAVVL